jgi:hypothetical protein
MARIRSAKPEWWTDPRMVALKRVIRWTFKGLWEVCADDEGRFLADPRVIKGQLWPMDDDLTPRQIETHLAALATAGRISLYVADGVRYGVVVNFLKHQKISHPTPSRLPSPPLGGLASGAGNPPEAYRNGSGEIPERLRPERSGAERDVDLDVDLERSGSEGPPAPPADAGTGEEPAEPTSALPYHARRLISAMPPEKRADGEEQLLATLTDRGANLDGQRVRAFSIAHLEDACLYKLRGKRPEKPGLLARFVLQRLNDTFAEWKSRVEKSDDREIAPAVSAVMPRQVDELELARDWLNDHSDVRLALIEDGDRKWAELGTSAKAQRMRLEWENRETLARWKAAGSPVHAAHGAAGQGGTP